MDGVGGGGGGRMKRRNKKMYVANRVGNTHKIIHIDTEEVSIYRV